MILTLFFFSAFLGIVRYYKFESILVTLVSQTPEVYAGVALLLLAVRVGIAICNFYPMVVNFFNSITRISETLRERLDRDLKSRNVDKSSPFKTGNSRRSYHSSAGNLPERGARVSLKLTPGQCTLRGANRMGRIEPLRTVPKSGPSLPLSVERGMENLYKTTLLRTRFKLDKIHEYISVKGGTPFINILKGITLWTGTRYSASSIRFLCTFARTCYVLIRAQGVRGLVIYMKSAHISLMQALGGHRVHDAGKLGTRFARTGSGIPRIIPIQFRLRIRNGDQRAIRLSLTLLSVYRVLSFPGILNVDTITKSSTANHSLDRWLGGMIPLFIRLFVLDRFSRWALFRNLHRLASGTIFPLFKGGPGVIGAFGQWNTYPPIILQGLATLYRNSTLWDSFTRLVHETGNTRIAWFIERLTPLLRFTLSRWSVSKGRMVVHRIPSLPTLGKLGLKEEPAGKIRVFAMVDPWTQWVLRPIHDLIFMILKDVKMDGTFDQHAPLKLVKAVRGLWSLDLKAATDRLPLWIQKELLGALLGRDLAAAWANLLVGRTYSLRLSEDETIKLSYAVGQPMGALSSWASLALTHHFLVQCAAWRAGFPRWKLYTNYAVLGDDVVIGDKRVALQYLAIMESLGVGVNTSKSLLSHRGSAMEFAKRTIVNGVDCSPIAFKEYFAATRSIGAWNALRRKTDLSVATALQAIGAGWQVRSWLNKPLGKLSARIRLLILSANVPTAIEDVVPFFEMGQSPNPRYIVDATQVISSFIGKEFLRIFTKLRSFGVLVRSMKESPSDALNWAKDFPGLGLDGDETLAWEGYPNWWSGVPVELAQPGTTSHIVHEVATGLFLLTHGLRQGQTKNWATEIRSLSSQIVGVQALLQNPEALSRSDFSKVYMLYLHLQEQVEAFDRNVLAKVRPNPQTVFGILDPSQVRLWKRWSQVLQGTVPVPLEQEVVPPKAEPPVGPDGLPVPAPIGQYRYDPTKPIDMRLPDSGVPKSAKLQALEDDYRRRNMLDSYEENIYRAMRRGRLPLPLYKRVWYFFVGHPRN